MNRRQEWDPRARRMHINGFSGHWIVYLVLPEVLWVVTISPTSRSHDHWHDRV